MCVWMVCVNKKISLLPTETEQQKSWRKTAVQQPARTQSGRVSSKSEPISPAFIHPEGRFFAPSPRFRPQVVEKLIHAILVEGLSDKQYSQDLCNTWTEQISDSIKTKLKG